MARKRFPVVPDKFSKTWAESLTRELEAADGENVKKGTEWNAVRFTLTEATTMQRYQVTVTLVLGVPTLTLTTV